jgi:hypothetical protein
MSAQQVLDPAKIKKLNDDFTKAVANNPLSSLFMCVTCPAAIVAVLGAATFFVAEIVFSIQSLVVGAQTYQYYMYQWVLNTTNSSQPIIVNGTIITPPPSNSSSNTTVSPQYYAQLAPNGNCMNIVGVWLIVFGSLGLAGCCLGNCIIRTNKPDGTVEQKATPLSVLGNLTSLACLCWLFYGTHLVYTEPWLACNASQYHVFYILIMFMFWLFIAVLCGFLLIFVVMTILYRGMSPEDQEKLKKDAADLQQTTQQQGAPATAAGTTAPPDAGTAAAAATTTTTTAADAAPAATTTTTTGGGQLQTV